MSLSANHLNELYTEVFRHLEKIRPVPEIEVKFYPYTGLHHTIRLRSGKAFVRLSDIIANAPIEVHRSLALVLVAKILGRKTPITHEKITGNMYIHPTFSALLNSQDADAEKKSSHLHAATLTIWTRYSKI